MASKNKVFLIGNLAKDPEDRTSQGSNSPFATFTLATNETWKDKTTGEKKQSTEWHNCVVNGQQAQYIVQYGRKGRLVELEGSLKTRKYTDKDGIERYVTEIRVVEFQFLDKPASDDSQAPSQSQQSGQRQQPQSQQRQQPARQQSAPPRTNGRASAPQENWATADDGFPE